MGKGDTPRPVNRAKWEAGWALYERRKREKLVPEPRGCGSGNTVQCTECGKQFSMFFATLAKGKVLCGGCALEREKEREPKKETYHE